MSDIKATKNKWGRQRYICKCGVEISRGGKFKHEQTKKHKRRLAEQQEDQLDPVLLSKIKLTFPLIDDIKLKRIARILME